MFPPPPPPTPFPAAALLLLTFLLLNASVGFLASDSGSSKESASDEDRTKSLLLPGLRHVACMSTEGSSNLGRVSKSCFQANSGGCEGSSLLQEVET